MEKNYRTLGGWLLFFVISFCIGLLFNAFVMFAGFRNFTIINNITNLLGVGLQVAILVLLFKRNRRFLTCYYSFAAYVLLNNLLGIVLGGASVVFIIPNLLEVVAWIAYFNRSKRVEVYLMPQTTFDAMQLPRTACFCSHCGTAVTPGAQFCGKCGKTL